MMGIIKTPTLSMVSIYSFPSVGIDKLVHSPRPLGEGLGVREKLPIGKWKRSKLMLV